MDGTPPIENEHSSSQSPAHSSPSETQLMSLSSGPQHQGQAVQQHTAQSQASSKNFSNVPHIRSRITVVCAECKRLKLKCDRRTPCGSCLKRDTVQRCIYSQAAAEKVDVQSLHNRLLVVEGTLAQLTATPQTGLPPVPPFKSSYPLNMVQVGLSGPSSSGQSSSASYLSRVNADSVLAGLPCNDRSCLVAGSSGNSVVISLDDTASIWLNELECNPPAEEGSNQRQPSVSPYSSTAKSGSSGSGATRVKLEPMPVMLPPHASASTSSSRRGLGFGRSSAFIPPVPYAVFLPSDTSSSTSYGPPTATSQTFMSTFSSVPDGSSCASSTRQDVPQVTVVLLGYLPSPLNVRSRYLASFEEIMRLHPTVNVQHFKRRIEAMMSWNDSSSEGRSKSELAKDVFGISAPPKKGNTPAKERNTNPAPTLSFFAATCAAFAIGALISRDNEAGCIADGDKGPRNTPAGLFALSEQALGYFEKTNSYDLDSLTAMLLQTLYLLHDGQMNVSQATLPLMGKLVNVARMMGLSMDPDEFPGTYSLFDAETRRRLWWDVYYYDMLVSECMGQQPLIGENTFTTKHLADADDDRFTPSSVSIPAPSGEDDENRTTFFVLRNKLGQLVRSIRKQTVTDLVADDSFELSVEQATNLETEIANFMNDLPQAYKLGQDHDLSQPSSTPTTSQMLVAQRCVLAIIANRAILKLYLPLLKEGNGTRPSHQAVLGCINASHSIIYACRLMHSLWRDSRPATFDFYDFGRTLFDAAVVCAHAVIQQPGSILAAEALKCVAGAADVMRVLSVTKLHGESSEAIKIVEMMKEKAERARAPGPSDTGAGSKRKRAVDEGSREITLTAGFQLPFVGPSVSSTRSDQSRPSLNMSKIASTGPKKDDAKACKSSSKEKEKEKKYPPVGIRSRPSSGGQVFPPPIRQRTNSMAPSPSPVTTSRTRAPSTAGVGPPPSSTTSQTSSSPEHHSSTSTPASDPSVSPSYTYPTQSTQNSSPHPAPPQEPVQQREFQLGFSGTNDAMPVDSRSFAQSYPSSAQASGYDQRSNNTSYAAPAQPASSFRQPQGSSEYFVQPYSAVSSQSYEQNQMPHTQALPMPAYGIPSPMDSSMGSNMTNSVPSTPRTQSFMLGPEKAAPPYLGKAELGRQVNQEYQPTATAHGVAMATQYVQGWPQPEMARNHWDYKYYGS